MTLSNALFLLDTNQLNQFSIDRLRWLERKLTEAVIEHLSELERTEKNSFAYKLVLANKIRDEKRLEIVKVRISYLYENECQFV